MASINDTFVNALLADASYVNGRTIVESVNYQGLGSGIQILVGATDQLSRRRQVVFGGEAGETLVGYGRGDALFGGAGNDTLIQLASNEREYACAA